MKLIGLMTACVAVGGVLATSAHAQTAKQTVSANGFEVTYEGEAAGVQNTTATFSVGGVENFETYSTYNGTQDVSTAITPGSNSYNGAQATYHDFTTDFGTNGAILGTYTHVDVIPADQYGGAGGTGSYAVSFGDTRGEPYTLTFNTPVNYFGYWLSALDPGNTASFYGSNGALLFTFNASDVISAINSSANPGEYYGNPNSAFRGQDGGEPYVFLNFFDTTGDFTKVVFSEVNNGGAGYESDNHTVGDYLTMGQGTVVPLSPAPEPATWSLMMAGVFGLGLALRRRRALAMATA